MKSQYILLVLAAYCGIASISCHVVVPVQKGMPHGLCVRKLISWHKNLCAFLKESEQTDNLDSNSMSSEDDVLWSISKEKALSICCTRPCTYSELMFLC